MAEMKVRAWLKKPLHCFNGEFLSKMIKPYMIGSIYYDKEFIRLIPGYGEYDFNFDDLILMNSTRILDKNKKEIYEGDIIDIHQTVNGQNLFIITVDKEAGKIMPTYIWGKPYEYDVFELLEYGVDDKEIEVIGNIYENPELLQVEQNTEVENTMKNKDLELLKKLIYDNCYLKTNGGSVNEGIDNVIEYLNDFPFTVTLTPHRVGNLKCKSQNCNTCPVRSICAIKGVNPELTFYENLEEYKTYEAKLFDRDLYDLIKVRLDKEVL